MRDVTCCLMYCGEETYEDCSCILQRGIRQGADFEFNEVKNITPASRALNQMFSQCNTKYLVPVDADMILNEGFYERICREIENAESRDNDRWHTILFPLWDTLTDSKIYALKVFNMAAMRSIPYKDDPCPDIQHYRDMTEAGLHSIDLFKESTIGDHVVRGKFICYAKYRDLYLTARSRPRDLLESHFKGGKTIRDKARSHYDFFLNRYESTKNEDYLYCVGGMLEGLKAPITFKSKDLGQTEMVYTESQSEQFLEWYESDKKHRVFI